MNTNFQPLTAYAQYFSGTHVGETAFFQNPETETYLVMFQSLDRLTFAKESQSKRNLEKDLYNYIKHNVF